MGAKTMVLTRNAEATTVENFEKTEVYKKDRYGNMLMKGDHVSESARINSAVTFSPRSTAEIAKEAEVTEERVLGHFAYQIAAGDKIGKVLQKTEDKKWYVTA